MTERTIQRESVKELRKRGYIVHVTSDNRKAHGTKGTPDAIVSAGRGLWVGLEFKGTKGKASPEQARLMASGNIHIVRSVAEALAAVAYSIRQIKED